MTGPSEQARDVKACCAAAYSSDLVALLLGPSYHPGGLALTRTLAGHLGVGLGDRVLDVAAGRGTTAILLATENRARVDGVDLAEDNVRAARDAAAAAGVGDRAGFRTGDAERLSFPDASVDVVVCECALCTFPDKAAAAGEFARVLRPGGRLGISDVVTDRDRLPDELTSLSAWIACVADARPVSGYTAFLDAAGLRVQRTERHDDALLDMIDRIEARLTLLRMAAPDRLATLGVDLGVELGVETGRAPVVLAAARDAVGSGALGYVLLTAAKPE